ncbi:MAG: NTP transferase domain-containing protein [Muribaculaceae bacterium]|nr:NTP transferase domain-containing protein [Muribaculaceae bacterium]
MKVMILCAGMGTRLKPWTEKHPKALVPVGGIPMLKRVGTNLIEQGFDEITVNVHHFGDQIISFIERDVALRGKTAISDERDMLLDTGGGILNAEDILNRDSRPFLVHNVDILSNADLRKLMADHEGSDRHATLLVSERASDRKLVFDERMRLKGWLNRKSGDTRPSSLKIEESDRLLSFSGIYAMSPEVFRIMRSNGFCGRFPIMDFFLSFIPNLNIGGMVQEHLSIIDIGKPDTLHRANLRINNICDAVTP